jgi:hypothetical protein
MIMQKLPKLVKSAASKLFRVINEDGEHKKLKMTNLKD